MIKGLCLAPPGAPFLSSILDYLWSMAKNDPLSLGNTTFILPTRRAIRTLTADLHKKGQNGAFLLPTFHTLQDIVHTAATPGTCALKPAVAKAHLAPLVRHHWGRLKGEDLPFQTAFYLGGTLLTLYEQSFLECGHPPDTSALMIGDYAGHLMDSAPLCDAVFQDFRAFLTQHNLMTPQEFFITSLKSLINQPHLFQKNTPIIAAGFDGSLRPIYPFLKQILNHPNGSVILECPDRSLDGAQWNALKPRHPGYLLKQLLDFLGASRENLPILGQIQPEPQRLDRLSRCFHTVKNRNDDAQSPLDPNLTLLSFQTLGEEGESIALLVRRHLHNYPTHRIAVLTPHRSLARIVKTQLRRFGITADDSVGIRLSETPFGTLALLILMGFRSGFTGSDLGAILTHPFVTIGLKPVHHRARARFLDRTWMRGAPVPMTLTTLTALSLTAAPDDPRRLLLNDFSKAIQPLLAFVPDRPYPLDEFIKSHIRVMETLSLNPQFPNNDRLWIGESGDAALSALGALRSQSGTIAPMTIDDYGVLLKDTLQDQMVRRAYGTSSQVMVWGPLQGRLQDADCVILGGLNAGVWPSKPASNPFLTDAMMEHMGLPPADKGRGLDTHDFIYHLNRPHVFLTRARREGGHITMPSEWFLRIQAFYGINTDHHQTEKTALDNARRQLSTASDYRPIIQPSPALSGDRCPRRLSVTAAETWHRHPYGFYAKFLLNLHPLPSRTPSLSPAILGTGVHRALELALKNTALTQDNLYQLLRDNTIGTIDFNPRAQVFWTDRLARLTGPLWDHLMACRRDTNNVWGEIRGSYTLHGTLFPVELTAKADRLDLTPAGINIIDYKTGSPGTRTAIMRGDILQLALEALIAENGGFHNNIPQIVQKISYVYLKGRGDNPLWTLTIDTPDDLRTIIQQADEIVRHLITGASKGDAVFKARFTPPADIKRGSYEHLERSSEWARLPH